MQKEVDLVFSETRRPQAGLQLCTGLDHFTFIALLCATVDSSVLECYRSCFTYPCGVFWAFEELMKMLRLPGNPVRHVRLRGHTQTKHIVKIIVLKDVVNAFLLTCLKKMNAKKAHFHRERLAFCHRDLMTNVFLFNLKQPKAFGRIHQITFFSWFCLDLRK